MGTSKKDKATIKKLLENDTVVNQKVSELKTTIDELLDKPNFNELYAKWKAENQQLPPLPPPETDPNPTPTCGGHSHWNGTACECDPGYHDLNGECVPNEQPPEPPQPNPAGVIYDSNTDGQWNNGVSR